jgi:hypothetical protein
MYVMSSTKIPHLILFWWKTWLRLAILVSGTTNLLEPKQYMNNQVSDSCLGEPSVQFCLKKLSDFNMIFSDLRYKVYKKCPSILECKYLDTW